MSTDNVGQKSPDEGVPRWKHPVVVRLLVLTAVGILLIAWTLIRSDAILGGIVTAQISKLERQLGAKIEYDGISATGLTGVEIRGLTVAHETIHGTVRIDAARIYPDVLAVFGRRLEIGSVELHGVNVEGTIDVGNLLERMSSPTTNGGGTEVARVGSPSCSGLRRAPKTLSIAGGAVALTDSDGDIVLPAVDLAELVLGVECRSAGVDISLRGQAIVDGSRVTLDLQRHADGAHEVGLLFSSPFDVTPYLSTFVDLEPGSTVEVSGLAARGGDSMTLIGLNARSFNTPIPQADRWRVDGLDAENLTLSLVDGSVMVDVYEATLHLLGILDSPSVAVASAHFWATSDLQHPDGWVVLGGGDRGTLALDFSRSRYDRSTTITASAESYDLTELIPLIPFQDFIRLDAGRMTGDIAVVLSDDTEQLWIDTEVALEDGRLSAPLVAARPLVGLDVTANTQLTMDITRSVLRMEESTVLFGEVPITVAADLDWSEPGGRLLSWATADDVSARALHEALPRGLAPSLEEAEFAGRLSAAVQLDLSLYHPETSVVALDLDLDAVEVQRFGPHARVDQLSGPFAIQGGHDRSDPHMFGPLTEGWVPLSDVGTHLTAALSCAEDGRFWEHRGFDEAAIMSSLEENLRQGRIVRGGSTISQQVARSLFLRQERTLGRKFEEAVLTWQLEERVTKERIMELYVNAVHWGPGIYGIGQAAATYFDAAPSELTLLESVFLASILSNPNVYGVEYARGVLVPSRREKVCNILLNMHHDGEIRRSGYEEACQAAMAGEISDAPRPTDLVPPAVPSTPTLSAYLH